MNFLKPTELTRDELIRLVECYERLGVTTAKICTHGKTSALTQTEKGWTAQKGDVLKALTRTKRGWRLSTCVLDKSSVAPLLEIAA